MSHSSIKSTLLGQTQQRYYPWWIVLGFEALAHKSLLPTRARTVLRPRRLSPSLLYLVRFVGHVSGTASPFLASAQGTMTVSSAFSWGAQAPPVRRLYLWRMSIRAQSSGSTAIESWFMANTSPQL